MVPNEELHTCILTIHFEPPMRGQPIYKGQDAWSQGAYYYNNTPLLYHIYPIRTTIKSNIETWPY